MLFPWPDADIKVVSLAFFSPLAASIGDSTKMRKPLLMWVNHLPPLQDVGWRTKVVFYWLKLGLKVLRASASVRTKTPWLVPPLSVIVSSSQGTSMVNLTCMTSVTYLPQKTWEGFRSENAKEIFSLGKCWDFEAQKMGGVLMDGSDEFFPLQNWGDFWGSMDQIQTAITTEWEDWKFNRALVVTKW